MKWMFRLLLAVGLLAPLVACGKKIGDACKDGLDCNSQDNSRTCDLSQPGGYCVIEGCDEQSCPDESVCVRFFPEDQFLAKTCDHTATVTGCEPQEICLQSNRCAPSAAELRRCVHSCGDNGDCRDHYECRATGGNSVALTQVPGTIAKFCAPNP